VNSSRYRQERNTVSKSGSLVCGLRGCLSSCPRIGRNPVVFIRMETNARHLFIEHPRIHPFQSNVRGKYRGLLMPCCEIDLPKALQPAKQHLAITSAQPRTGHHHLHNFLSRIGTTTDSMCECTKGRGTDKHSLRW